MKTNGEFNSGLVDPYLLCIINISEKCFIQSIFRPQC